MSLDVYLEGKEVEVECCLGHTHKGRKELYWANITHNLSKMAAEAGIYDYLWHPERISKDITARQLITPIQKGLEDMKNRPQFYSKFSAENGWGTYSQFIPWIEKYLEALIDNPAAIVRTDT